MRRSPHCIDIKTVTQCDGSEYACDLQIAQDKCLYEIRIAIDNIFTNVTLCVFRFRFRCPGFCSDRLADLRGGRGHHRCIYSCSTTSGVPWHSLRFVSHHLHIRYKMQRNYLIN